MKQTHQIYDLQFARLLPFVSCFFLFRRAEYEALIKQISPCHEVTKTQRCTSKIPIHRKNKENQ